ncbi:MULTISPECIES: archease [Thermomonospora]|uniref:SHS2 domain-containing protein n=1 Tax=Thermomonospora cellulosilytica TaxID=1411118 RepID=A0A7W3MYA0_9ACTN|nr:MULTISPECIES: archease [Thermomonospora]MBA9004120.1 SHS2 domain-containing protein [Thermomonospora cellulosilytica]
MRPSSTPAAGEGGHRGVPHTADLRIEAWGPTWERCIAEAVAGLVESFADTSGVRTRWTVTVDVPPGPDADVLVAVLDEVIYRLDVDGEVVLGAEITRAPDGRPAARLSVGDAAEATAVGAVPKAVSLHDLRFGPEDGRWSCAVTIDV